MELTQVNVLVHLLYDLLRHPFYALFEEVHESSDREFNTSKILRSLWGRRIKEVATNPDMELGMKRVEIDKRLGLSLYDTKRKTGYTRYKKNQLKEEKSLENLKLDQEEETLREGFENGS